MTEVFSSGGGTQSSCIAAMICLGELPKKAIRERDDSVWLSGTAKPLGEIDYEKVEDQQDMFGAYCPNTGCFT